MWWALRRAQTCDDVDYGGKPRHQQSADHRPVGWHPVFSCGTQEPRGSSKDAGDAMAVASAFSSTGPIRLADAISPPTRSDIRTAFNSAGSPANSTRARLRSRFREDRRSSSMASDAAKSARTPGRNLRTRVVQRLVEYTVLIQVRHVADFYGHVPTRQNTSHSTSSASFQLREISRWKRSEVTMSMPVLDPSRIHANRSNQSSGIRSTSP